MLRCVLRRRIITTVSCKLRYQINTSSLIKFGTQQALWTGLAEKCTWLPEKLCTSSICSSTQHLPNELTEISSEIPESKKLKKVKRAKVRVRETEKQQKLTKNENGSKEDQAFKKKGRKKKSKENASEELASDVLNHRTFKQSEDRIEEPPSLSFPFDGSSYSETDDEFSIYHHGTPDLSFPGQHSVVRMVNNNSSEGRFYQVSSEGASVFFPSVTTVLSNTVSKSQYYRLRNWKRSMIREHGEAEFESIQQQYRDTGTHFHQKLEQKLHKLMLPDAISIKPQRHVPVPDNQSILSHHRRSVLPFTNNVTNVADEGSERNLGDKLEVAEQEDSEYVKSVEHVLEQITCVLALESVVTHHELGYTGTFDCIAKYSGEVCLIDWKSSFKPKPTLGDCFDFPLQAVAYAGAVNHDDHYPFKVFNALIVVAYADGAPAHAHFLSHEQCQDYWSKWLHRLQEYQTQFASDHSNVY